MESILTSVKKLLGITEEYEHFDQDIIVNINSVFSILKQLGVGPPNGFIIKSNTEKWADFMPEYSRLEAVKSYVHLKVKLLFDPPLSTAVMEAMNRMISELEWRMNLAAEEIEKEGGN